MDGFQFLNQLLDVFRNASITGMINLKPAALGLVAVLGILDVTAMWGLYFGEMRVREIVGKVIKIGFFTILILNWGPLTTYTEDTFVKIGQIASSETAATKPSSIMEQGFKIGYRLMNNAVHDIPLVGKDGSDPVSEESKTPYYDENGDLVSNYDNLLKEGQDKSFVSNPFSGLGDAMASIPGRLLKLVLALAIILAFAFIALNVLLCYIEFYLTTALSIILLPFGVNSHTSFISQKALGAVVNFGVKLMIMIFLLGLMSKMIADMDVIKNDDYGKLFEVVLQSCMYAFLLWKLPSLISGMLSGTPSMGASAAGVANAGMKVAGVAGRAGSAGAQMGAQAMANAARIGGGAYKAGKMAAASSGATNTYGIANAALTGAMKHIGAATSMGARHQINTSKATFLNRVTPKESAAARASRRLGAVSGSNKW